MTIRVALIDDDPQIHKLISRLISSTEDIHLVGTRFLGGEAVELCHETEPDLVLMDVQLPDKSGIECARDIREQFPHIKILALSAFSEFEYIQAMLASGAVGYIAKSVITADLLDTIHEAHRGTVVLSSDVAQVLVSPPTGTPNPDFQLTPRELDVLRLLAKGKQDKQIAQELGITVPTVRLHLGNLVAKMGAHNRSEALVVAVKFNLI